MARYRWLEVDGKKQWVPIDLAATRVVESLAPAVHQDTFKRELVHPVTEEVVNSMTRWKAINKEHGLTEVGNDLLSKKKRVLPEKVTEEVILDRIERAEAILSDPAKRREYENMNLERYERNQRLAGRS